MDPKELLNNPDQIKNLIALLQTMLPNEDAEVSQPKKRTKKKSAKISNTDISTNEDIGTNFNSKIKTKNKRAFQPSTINQFEKMSEFNMHKDDREVDQKLSKHPPVARTRDFEPVSVVCRICGKKEIVSPSLVYEGPSRYKCNNCSTQAG
jgi:hypothetical protein